MVPPFKLFVKERIHLGFEFLLLLVVSVITIILSEPFLFLSFFNLLFNFQSLKLNCSEGASDLIEVIFNLISLTHILLVLIPFLTNCFIHISCIPLADFNMEVDLFSPNSQGSLATHLASLCHLLQLIELNFLTENFFLFQSILDYNCASIWHLGRREHESLVKFDVI